MPTYMGEGATFWPRSEVGLGPVTAPQIALSPRVRIHYTTGATLGHDDPSVWTRNIDNFHRNTMGWQHGFAYNFGIARDPDHERAHIIEGRGWMRRGGHTLGANDDVGVVFYGEDVPGVVDITPGVQRAFALVLGLHRLLMRDKGVSAPQEVFPHSATSATACPGNELRALILAGFPATPYGGNPTAVPMPVLPAPLPVPPVEARFARPRPTLQRGSITQGVSQLQQALNLWEARLVVDGIYGRRTRHAVVNFQRFWGLAQDGIYGPITAKALDGALTLAGR